MDEGRGFGAKALPASTMSNAMERRLRTRVFKSILKLVSSNMAPIFTTLSTLQLRMSGLIIFLKAKTSAILVTSVVSHVSIDPYVDITSPFVTVHVSDTAADTPLPTTSRISPPLPPVAVPVETEIDPDDPELVVPDENESIPDTPNEKFADWVEAEPDILLLQR